MVWENFPQHLYWFVYVQVHGPYLSCEKSQLPHSYPSRRLCGFFPPSHSTCPLYHFSSIGTELADSYTLQIKWLPTLITAVERENEGAGNRKRTAIGKTGQLASLKLRSISSLVHCSPCQLLTYPLDPPNAFSAIWYMSSMILL